MQKLQDAQEYVMTMDQMNVHFSMNHKKVHCRAPFNCISTVMTTVRTFYKATGFSTIQKKTQDTHHIMDTDLARVVAFEASLQTADILQWE